MEVSSVFQESFLGHFKKASRVFERSFMGVSMKFQEILKEVL